MWIAIQSTGELYHRPNLTFAKLKRNLNSYTKADFLLDDSDRISVGYSGKARGKNNPSMQGVAGVGPLPRGPWKIGGVYNSERVGRFAIYLDAFDSRPGDDKHQPTGRGAFRIHGDSIAHPGNASNGCLIHPIAVRRAIVYSKDSELLCI